MLGLRCSTQSFSSCSEQRLLSSYSAWASHYGGFPCCRAWSPGLAGSVVSQATMCGIFPGQGSNPCPLHFRWILHHWTLRGSPVQSLCMHYLTSYLILPKEVNTVLGPILLLRKLGSRDVTYPRLLSRWQKQSLNYLTPKPKFLSKIFHASHHIGLAAQRQKCGGIVELMSVRMNSGPWASFAVNRFADKKPLCG